MMSGLPDSPELVSYARVSELQDERWRAMQNGVFRSPPKERDEDGGYTFAEVLGEVRIIVADAARFLAEDPSREMRALAAAGTLAELRDENRLRAHREVPLGDYALRFAVWLIQRADHGDIAAAAQSALDAAAGSSAQSALAAELRDYICGVLNGSISGDEDDRRQRHPRANLRACPAPAPVSPDPVAASAAEALSRILAEAGMHEAVVDPSTVWQAFTRFAAEPIRPEPPERLDPESGDLLLFEWGVFGPPWADDPEEVFLIDLVRQFGVLAEDGEYDRMEQVHCTLTFEPDAQLRGLGAGAIWSGAGLSEWLGEVERSDGYRALSSHRANALRVEHERV